MADYKKMYLKMFRAVENAKNILIAAQQECEELYINAPETQLEICMEEEKKPTDQR